MTPERWKGLSEDDGELTPEEVALGWHWCFEFDGLLVGPGMSELSSCRCLAFWHPVYSTAPEAPVFGPFDEPF